MGRTRQSRAGVFAVTAITISLAVAAQPNGADAGVDAPDKLSNDPIVGDVAVEGQILGGSAEFRSSAQVSPDGSFVVYIADADVVGAHELWSVPVDGGAPTRLNAEYTGPLAGADVVEFEITADDSTVVYIADERVDNIAELFAVPIDGSSAPTQIGSSLVAGRAVTDVIVSPDPAATLVAYVSDETTNDVFALHGVPLVGGTVTTLSDGGDVVDGSATISDDGMVASDDGTVAYISDELTAGTAEVFTVPLDDSAAPTVVSGAAMAGDATEVQIAADGSRVVYLANQDDAADIELFSVTPDGITSAKLNGVLGANEDVAGSGTFRISADSASVLYFSDRNTNNRFDGYVAPIAGGSRQQINTALDQAGEQVFGGEFVDAGNVVYRSNHDTGPTGAVELFHVNVTTLTPTELHTGADVLNASRFAITSDGERAVALSDHDGSPQLYSVPVAGDDDLTTLNQPLAMLGEVRDFVIVPDSSGVVFTADANTAGTDEVYRADWIDPTATDSAETVEVDTTTTFTLDVDPVGFLGDLMIDDPQPVGSVTILTATTIDYTAPSAATTDTINYTTCATDDSSLCDSAVVTVTVTDPPPPTPTPTPIPTPTATPTPTPTATPTPTPTATPTPTPAPTRNRIFVTNVIRSGPAEYSFIFGDETQEILVGDWDGNGHDGFALRDGKTITEYNERGVLIRTVSYGSTSDTRYRVGDWDGDGTDTLAVQRANIFFITNSPDATGPVVSIGFGRRDDEVFVGDWDNDGIDTFAVRRKNEFFVRNSITTGPADIAFGYGKAADEVLVGDWDTDGLDTFAVRRGNVIFIRNDFQTGVAETTIGYGKAADTLFVGDWNADNIDTFAVRRPE